MKKLLFLLTTVLIFQDLKLEAQHGHLEAGAVSPTAGSQLIFANGETFSAENGFVLPLVWADEGPYSGYFHGNVTFTVRAATLERGGPEANHPALGAEVHAELLGVERPAGGSFGFWEPGSVEPVVSLEPGVHGHDYWHLSENGGESGTDPYGHVHGRRFTATQPGIYTASFRLVDRSTHGLEGGPIHLESDPIEIRFIAGDGIPVQVRDSGDYVLSVALHDAELHAALREDDGHTDHVHDPLDLTKMIFAIQPHYRVQVGADQHHLGTPGAAAWYVPHASQVTSLPADGQTVEPGPEHGEGMSHDHSTSIEWDGAEAPEIALEVAEDPKSGYNVFLQLSGFEFSPENASTEHIPGQGHAHIYVDGVKIGRVYTKSYHLSSLTPGSHHVRVTLNANSHQDFTHNGELLQASAEIVVPEPVEEASDEPGHGDGHVHGSELRPWDGEVEPVLGLRVVPDPASGWNLLFDYQHFNLNPRNASREHVPGEGHTHIYVNGEKLTRLYGRAYHLGALPAGDVEVSVTLSGNDHVEYSLHGLPLGVTTYVHNGEHEGSGAQPLPLSFTLSALDLGDGALVDDVVKLTLTSVHGPGSVRFFTESPEEGHNHGGETEGLAVWAHSGDGLGEDDHVQWPVGHEKPIMLSFSKPGDYALSLAFSGTLIGGEGKVEEEIELQFQVLPSSKLHHNFVAGTLHLTWDTGAPLQHASAVGGHYHEVEGAHGHYEVPMTSPAGFFRLAAELLVDSGQTEHNHE